MPVRLSDGVDWLLSTPLHLSYGKAKTSPDIDAEIDRLFEHSVLTGEVVLTDVWSAARILLVANYDLTDAEFVELVRLPKSGRQAFVTAVLEALFGDSQAVRSYTAWCRASLLANGIVHAEIPPGDVANVLAILVATRRTIPASQFIDASRAAEEQAALESLV